MLNRHQRLTDTRAASEGLINCSMRAPSPPPAEGRTSGGRQVAYSMGWAYMIGTDGLGHGGKGGASGATRDSDLLDDI